MSPATSGLPSLRATLARLISLWHLEFGERRGGTSHSVVAWLLEADMDDPLTQRELAWMQVAGDLEWAYHQPVPRQLWDAITSPSGDAPATLGIAGRQLLTLLESLECDAASLDDADAERVTVHVRDQEGLVHLAVTHFPSLAADEAMGIGGACYVVSSSLERTSVRPHAAGEFTLLSPGVLGAMRVRPTQDTDLVNLVRNGQVEVVSVIGEPVHGARHLDRNNPTAPEL